MCCCVTRPHSPPSAVVMGSVPYAQPYQTGPSEYAPGPYQEMAFATSYGNASDAPYPGGSSAYAKY